MTVDEMVEVETDMQPQLGAQIRPRLLSVACCAQGKERPFSLVSLGAVG